MIGTALAAVVDVKHSAGDFYLKKRGPVGTQTTPPVAAGLTVLARRRTRKDKPPIGSPGRAFPNLL